MQKLSFSKRPYQNGPLLGECNPPVGLCDGVSRVADTIACASFISKRSADPILNTMQATGNVLERLNEGAPRVGGQSA